MSRRIRLRQDVTIEDIADDDDGLKVVVSTRAGHRHWIRFLCEDLESLSNQLTILRRWMHSGTPLTYTSRGAEGALIDDRAWFEQAFFGGVDR